MGVNVLSEIRLFPVGAAVVIGINFVGVDVGDELGLDDGCGSVGDVVGAKVKVGECDKDGRDEGCTLTLGTCVILGILLGTSDGVSLGCSEGKRVGKKLGLLLGFSLGSIEGKMLGIALPVGPEVGSTDGWILPLGDDDGTSEGDSLGLWLGCSEGDSDG